MSKEASDIVLLDDSFATIVKAVEWGRNIYENFKRFISFQLTVNIASVICVFVSVLMGLPRLIMMNEGKIIYDVSGEEKKKLTTKDLLDKFKVTSGEEFDNDRVLLSTEAGE